MRWLKGLMIFAGFILFLFGTGLVLIIIYKKEIIAEATSQLQSAIHAEVKIRDADITLFSEFPNFTLKLEDVGIKDPSARPGDHDLLNVKSVLVNVRTYKLFFKQIEFRSIKIVEGEFFVFRSKSGYSNLDVFKQRKDTTVASPDSTRDFTLTNEKILFRNLRFTWHDSLRNKFIDLTLRDVETHVAHFDSLVDCQMRGQIDIEHLTFNPDRGSFLKNQATNVNLAFNFFPDSAKLRLKPSILSLHESEFNVKGVFDFKEKNIILNIASDRLNYAEGLAVIPETISTRLSKLAVGKPFGIDVQLEAPMGQKRLPWVEVKFDLKNNVFKSSFVTITDLSLTGMMTNHHDPSQPVSNGNSAVKLDNVVGKVDELPFEAHAVLSDFDDLLLDIFSKHTVTLPQLNREVDTTSIRFNEGKFVSEFHYKGKMSEYFDPESGTYKGDLEGKATLEKGAFTLMSRKLDFKDIGMSMHFNEDTVWIDQLGISLGKSSANLRGVISNYVPYFTKLNKGYVKLKITSPNIDMGSFLVKKSSRKKSVKEANQDKKKVSDMLDKVFTKLHFDIDVSVDKLKNRTFSASKISGNVKMNGSSLVMNNIRMNLGGGKLNMSLTMKDLQKDVNPVDVKANASNIAVKELFKAFDNFHQKTITDRNLEGLISFDTRFGLRLNDDFNVILPSFKGDMNMVVRDGRLINVEAIHNMSNFLFRRRDFDDVRFAQINGKVKVSHRDVLISRMEIQSTVLTLFLEGKYSLDNDTNLSIQVPLSNLKKRDRDYVPKNVGVDAKVGPSVYLLAKGTPDGKTDITYDGLRLKDKDKDKTKGKKKKR
ncbi:MAG TPA: AsmA family protein [Cyclobacteriaceae bacterium]